MLTANSLEKTLMIEGKRRRWRQRMRWLDNIIDSMHMNLSNLRETVEDRGGWRVAVHGVVKSQTWLSEQQQQQHGDILDSWLKSLPHQRATAIRWLWALNLPFITASNRKMLPIPRDTMPYLSIYGVVWLQRISVTHKAVFPSITSHCGEICHLSESTFKCWHLFFCPKFFSLETSQTFLLRTKE